MDLTNTAVTATSEMVTDLALKETCLSVYPTGTVLVAMYGGFQQIGRTGLLRIPAAVNQAIAAIQPRPGRIVPEYLLGILNFRVEYWRTVASSSRKDPNITSEDVRKFPIAYPSCAEQQVIAAALGDIDELLSSLEELIDKKHALKQAAMQQLLTGKTRLYGFHADWEMKKLSDEAECFSGGTPPTYVAEYYDGDIPWITSSDLNRGHISSVNGRISQSGLKNSAAKMVESGTLLIALYGATSGVTAVSGMRAAINQAVLAVLPRTASTEFLYYKLTSLKNWIISTYTQGGQPNLSGEIVKSIALQLPPTEEQKAIATVLSDMDAEITALELRVTKTRALKQGMMQELLTGKTRLTSPAPTNA